MVGWGSRSACWAKAPPQAGHAGPEAQFLRREPHRMPVQSTNRMPHRTFRLTPGPVQVPQPPRPPRPRLATYDLPLRQDHRPDGTAPQATKVNIKGGRVILYPDGPLGQA